MILPLPVNESIDFSSNAREDVPVNRSFKKRIFLLPFLPILSVFFPVFLGCSKDRYPQKARVSVLTGAHLNLDGGTDTLHIPYNTELTVTGATEDDYRVTCDGQTGTISRWYLEIADQPLKTIRYTRGIEGVPLYRSPGGTIITHLATATEVIGTGGLTRTVKRLNSTYLEFWIKVSTPNATGWVDEQQLSSSPVEFYFASIARSGLNLRSGPSLDSSISGLIPYKESGRVLLRQRDTFRIENRKGSWMKVEYNGKQGWVFSGFALIGTDPDFTRSFELATLEYFENLYSNAYEWESGHAPIPVTAERREQSGYEIYTSREKPPDDGCSADLRTTVFLREPMSQKQYTIQAEDNVSVSSGPLDNMLFARQSHCRCCCPHITEALLVLLPGRLLSYPYQPESHAGAGSCDFGPVYSVHFGQEMRRSTDGRTFYMHLKYPSCALEGPPSDMEMGVVQSEDFVSELFVRMHFNDMQSEPQIDRVFDEGVPESYRAEWDAARPFRQEAQAPY